MRLDKFIAENTGLTRSQATKAIRQSAVKINGEIVKNGATKVSQEDEIYFEDELLPWVRRRGNILCCISHKATFALTMMVTTQPFINSLNRLFLASYTALAD